MTLVAAVLVLMFAAYIFRNYVWRLIQTKRHGTETDAFVSRIEEVDMRSAGSSRYGNCRWYYYYAGFPAESGLHEVRLLNPSKNLAPGSRIRIRYLDETVEYAVLTEVLRDDPAEFMKPETRAS